MKSAKLLNLFAVGVLAITFAAGCKRQPKNITTIPGIRTTPGGPGMSGPADQGARIGLDGVGNQNLQQGEIPTPLGGEIDKATLGQYTVYFDFDRFTIKTSEQSKLDAVGTYLKSTPGVQLVVQGHCDERGTEEYNRALGERRAIAAREYLLQKHGISSERVTTASFGEDQPVAVEKTEEAYARNRRAEFGLMRGGQ